LSTLSTEQTLCQVLSTNGVFISTLGGRFDLISCQADDATCSMIGTAVAPEHVTFPEGL